VAGKYRTFSPESREEAARMVIETSRPIAEVGRELGVNETSLGNWVRAYRVKHVAPTGSYRIRPAFRRSTAFSCRSASSSAFFSSSPRTTRTARLNNQRISRQAILSSTWPASHHRTSRAGK
jgi:transposase-like protein